MKPVMLITAFQYSYREPEMSNKISFTMCHGKIRTAMACFYKEPLIKYAGSKPWWTCYPVKHGHYSIGSISRNSYGAYLYW